MRIPSPYTRLMFQCVRYHLDLANQSLKRDFKDAFDALKLKARTKTQAVSGRIKAGGQNLKVSASAAGQSLAVIKTDVVSPKVQAIKRALLVAAVFVVAPLVAYPILFCMWVRLKAFLARQSFATYCRNVCDLADEILAGNVKFK